MASLSGEQKSRKIGDMDTILCWYADARSLCERYIPTFFRFRILAKYGISGAVAAVVQLASLYALTELAGFWYLSSSVMAYFAAFAVSFFMQKFWTFRSNNMERIHHQALWYFCITAINLVLNTILVYALVDIVAIRLLPFTQITPLIYLFAQIIAALLISIESFFVYRHIFHGTKKK